MMLGAWDHDLENSLGPCSISERALRAYPGVGRSARVARPHYPPSLAHDKNIYIYIPFYLCLYGGRWK